LGPILSRFTRARQNLREVLLAGEKEAQAPAEPGEPRLRLGGKP